MDALPYEVWDLIISLLTENEPPPPPLELHGTPERPRLRRRRWSSGLNTPALSLAATCSTLYDLVAQRHWVAIVVQGRSELEHLATLCVRGPSHRPDMRLGHLVRRLEISITDEEYSHLTLATLLHQTPHVQSLILDSHLPLQRHKQAIPTSRGFSPTVMEAIGSLHHLEVLQFRGVLEVPSLRGICQISQTCPLLRQLWLTDVAGVDTLCSPPGVTYTLSFPNLTDLKIGGRLATAERGATFTSFLNFFTHHRASMPSLRNLHALHHLPHLATALPHFSDILSTGALLYGVVPGGTLPTPMQYRALRTLVAKLTRHAIPPIPAFPSLQLVKLLELPVTSNDRSCHAVHTTCEQFLNSLVLQPPPRLQQVAVYIPTKRKQPPLQAMASLSRRYSQRQLDLVVHPHPIPLSRSWKEHLLIAGN